MKKKKLFISLVFGLAISGVALYFSFRNIDFGRLLEYIASINYWWIIPMLAVAFLSFIFRVWRWQILMHSVYPLRFWEAFHPMMIGFAMNCILPGRVGELARPTIISQQKGASFFSVLATVAAERTLDLLMLLVFFAAVMSRIEVDPAYAVEFGGYTVRGSDLDMVAQGMVRISFVLILGMVLVTWGRSRALMERVVLALPELLFFASPETRQMLRQKVCSIIVGIMERIAEGFGMLQSFRKLFWCLVLSFGTWLTNGATYIVMVQGCPGFDLNIFQWYAVMVIICVFIALPSAPGFWGLWEAGGIFALSLFGIPETQAAGFILVNHVIQILPVIIVGLISAIVMGVNIMQVSEQASQEEEGPKQIAKTPSKA